MQDYVAVIGAVNMDVGGRPFKALIPRDSNPGTVSLSPGGVGRNIAHNLRLLDVPVVFWLFASSGGSETKSMI